MQGSNEEDKSDSKQNEADATPSCVPKIVMNYVSDAHSTGNSLNSKDISFSTKNKRRDKKNRRKDKDMRASVLAEGQRSEVARSEASAISSEPRLQESGWTKLSLAKASTALDKHTAMERADMGPSYTSDEWEADSDSDDDHTDSSDDDDPKSQVDRLIERGTLMYMEGENSALSSEGESDTDDEYDSESDITDVSPLVSAAASPLGLSPVLPRRIIPTSPLALHDNRDLNLEYDDPNHSPFDWDNPSPSPPLENYTENVNLSPEEDDNGSTSMNLLLQAVIELENQNNIENFNLNNHNSNISGLPNPSTDSVFIHPIRDNPHHVHLSKNFHRRKNMSFSNDEVRTIDRENKILLKKIMAAHTRKPTLANPNAKLDRYPKPTNSASNRKKEERIRKENLLLLKKIQEAKPTKDIVAPLGDVDSRISFVGVSRGNMRPPTRSCGNFLRSVLTPNVHLPPSRKETAL